MGLHKVGKDGCKTLVGKDGSRSGQFYPSGKETMSLLLDG